MIECLTLEKSVCLVNVCSLILINAITVFSLAFTPQPIAPRANIGEGHAEGGEPASPSASPLPRLATPISADDNPEAPKQTYLSDESDESPSASPVPAAEVQVT